MIRRSGICSSYILSLLLENSKNKTKVEARRRRRIVSLEFEEVRNFCCSKIVTHRFVRIRGAYVRQARGKAHGRVARRREGESRGKGTGGGGVVPEGEKRWSVTPHPTGSFRDLTPEGG